MLYLSVMTVSLPLVGHVDDGVDEILVQRETREQDRQNTHKTPGMRGRTGVARSKDQGCGHFAMKERGRDRLSICCVCVRKAPIAHQQQSVRHRYRHTYRQSSSPPPPPPPPPSPRRVRLFLSFPSTLFASFCVFHLCVFPLVTTLPAFTHT